MPLKRILIVDDEKECCELFRDFFTKKGYIVDMAYDGPEAKDLLERKRYGIIFVDCHMPDMSGVELIKIIKEKNPKALKIMISGYGAINEDFAKSLGVDIFLDKPISFETLRGIIEKNG